MSRINISIVKAILLCTFITAYGLPLDSSTPSEDLSKLSEEEFDKKYVNATYDQRQNGTENYRIHVDGVVLVVAPAEALLLASGASGLGEENLSSLIQDGGILDNSKPGAGANAPKPKPEHADELVPKTSKAVQRSSIRLINLLTPFFKRLRN